MRALALACLLGAAPAAAAELEPGLYFRGRRTTVADWPAQREALDRLTDRFLAEVRPPFVVPAGRRLAAGLDDLAHHPVRDAAGRMHDAIDVGARVLVGDSPYFETLKDALVHPIHPGGVVSRRHDGHYVAQRVELADGPYRLVLDVVYAHVTPAAGALSPARPVGRLEGLDEWRALDPDWRRILPFKGNHVHLLVRGVNDLPEGNPRPRDPTNKDYAAYRARFYNERLLPLVLRSR